MKADLFIHLFERDIIADVRNKDDHGFHELDNFFLRNHETTYLTPSSFIQDAILINVPENEEVYRVVSLDGEKKDYSVRTFRTFVCYTSTQEFPGEILDKVREFYKRDEVSIIIR